MKPSLKYSSAVADSQNRFVFSRAESNVAFRTAGCMCVCICVFVCLGKGNQEFRNQTQCPEENVSPPAVGPCLYGLKPAWRKAIKEAMTQLWVRSFSWYFLSFWRDDLITCCRLFFFTAIQFKCYTVQPHVRTLKCSSVKMTKEFSSRALKWSLMVRLHYLCSQVLDSYRDVSDWELAPPFLNQWSDF